MNNKVTKRVLKYPGGYEPNLVIPKQYKPYRYILGHIGTNNIMIMAMNPSSASEQYADATVSKVIKTAISNGYDGWIMCNLYPERSTDQMNMENFNLKLHKNNVKNIINTMKEYNISEIWGAWGNLKSHALKNAKKYWLDEFINNDIKLYCFNELSKQNNPKHPLYLKIDFSNKFYIDVDKLSEN